MCRKSPTLFGAKPGAWLSSMPSGRSSRISATWSIRSLWGITGPLWSLWNASHLSRFNLTLFVLSLLLWTGTRDAWTESRATVTQLRAAQFRAESAQKLAPAVRRLHDIAVHGVRTEEDLDWARTACAIVAADIYLQGVTHGQWLSGCLHQRFSQSVPAIDCHE
jgi:hypothetical protein